jgi:predicted RNase H-like HicB family nuclease
MKREFTAIIEEAPEGGFWAWCPEISGANGQGETVDETRENLKEAIKLILEDKFEDFSRGLSDNAIIEPIAVE